MHRRSNAAGTFATGCLARKTGVRLLYTGDRDLIEDFKDKQFIDRPRGKVYTRAENARLLAATACAARAR